MIDFDFGRARPPVRSLVPASVGMSTLLATHARTATNAQM